MGLKLDSLYLENFKCYENSGKIPFHNLTVFIGENDAGKSTIYDALDLVLNNNSPKSEDFRDGLNTIEIKMIFSLSVEIEELSQYIIDDKVTIIKKYNRDSATILQILGRKFEVEDLNNYGTMKAADLIALLERLELPPKSNQDLRKESIMNYISEESPTTVNDYIDINWSQISAYLPLFQRYSSSDYGNPTSSVRKTLDLVYREAFYERDGNGTYSLKNDFSNLQNNIKQSLNQKLETQLLSYIRKYNTDIQSVSGDFDIDFARGLNFSGLRIKNNANESRNIEQLGEGSKKKIFLSILE